MGARLGMWTVAVCLGAASGASPAGAQDFDTTFCASMKAGAEKINADSPMWVDKVTRQDWMLVLCSARVVEWKKFVKRAPLDREKELLEQRMSGVFCKNPRYLQAIRGGWRVAYRFTFQDGSQMETIARCPQ